MRPEALQRLFRYQFWRSKRYWLCPIAVLGLSLPEVQVAQSSFTWWPTNHTRAEGSRRTRLLGGHMGDDARVRTLGAYSDAVG